MTAFDKKPQSKRKQNISDFERNERHVLILMLVLLFLCPNICLNAAQIVYNRQNFTKSLFLIFIIRVRLGLLNVKRNYYLA